jgi:hypothetical protein
MVLRHEGNLLSIFLNVELVDRFAIEQNPTFHWIVESLDQLDSAGAHERIEGGKEVGGLHCTFTASTGTNQSDIIARLHFER